MPTSVEVATGQQNGTLAEANATNATPNATLAEANATDAANTTNVKPASGTCLTNCDSVRQPLKFNRVRLNSPPQSVAMPSE